MTTTARNPSGLGKMSKDTFTCAQHTVGGKGASFSSLSELTAPDYHLARSDLRRIAQAARDDWEVDPSIGCVLASKVGDILDSPRHDREFQAAMNAMLAILSHNVRADVAERTGKRPSRYWKYEFRWHVPATRTGRTIHTNARSESR